MFSEKDRSKCDKLLEKYYADRQFSRTLYRELIREQGMPGDRVLDAGCGRYLEFSKEFSSDVQVVGIDLETALDTHNEHCPYGLCGDLERLPFPCNSFDLVISRSVIEHLKNPIGVFQEFHRVLKPGGKVIFSTPNKYDYVSVIARLTPYWVHRALVSKILKVPEADVFPTFYRANTLTSLAEKLRDVGFIQRRLEAVNHYPAYLMFSPTLFRLGVFYERLTSLRWLAFLRGTILCVFQKTSGGL